MDKLALLIILLITLAGGFFFFWKLMPVQPSALQKVIKNIPIEEPSEVLSKTKEAFNKNSENSIKEIKNTAYVKAKKILDTTFAKKETAEEEVDVKITSPSNSPPNSEGLYVIDLSKDGNIKLGLSKNKKYQLKFLNVPLNFCLYIQSKKYTINNESGVELQFSSGGNYPIKANLCDLQDKNIGELVVTD